MASPINVSPRKGLWLGVVAVVTVTVAVTVTGTVTVAVSVRVRVKVSKKIQHHSRQCGER